MDIKELLENTKARKDFLANLNSIDIDSELESIIDLLVETRKLSYKLGDEKIRIWKSHPQMLPNDPLYRRSLKIDVMVSRLSSIYSAVLDHLEQNLLEKDLSNVLNTVNLRVEEAKKTDTNRRVQ